MDGRTIGIISIKGGVGKTSTVVALAAALAKEFGKKVLIVDANFSSPHLGFHIGLYNPETTIHHVLDGKVNIKEAIYESEHGFDILPGAMIYGKINPFKLADKLRELRRKYDVILIDSSPNLNEEVLSTMIASDEIIMVTTPDYVTLASTLRAVRLAKERKTPISGIILNKVYGKKFELDLDEVENTSGVSVLAVLPHDISIVEALSKATPSTLNEKNTEAIREYKKLAGALIGEIYYDKPWRRAIKKFFGIVPKHEINRAIYSENRLNNY